MRGSMVLAVGPDNTANDKPATRAPSPPQADHSLDVRHWALKSLLQIWREAHRGDDLPRRADLSPARFGRAMPHVALIDVEGDPPRYRWRLIGTHVTKRLGRDKTGRWFDEIYDAPTLARLCEVYGESVTQRVAIRYTGSFAFAGKEHLPYEALHLPLVDDGGRVSMLLIAVAVGR